jgi:cytochrome c
MLVRVFIASLMVLSVGDAACAAEGGEIGPTLVGLVGRQAGAGDSRFPYSQALKESKLVWEVDALDRFLADPPAAVPGTAMPMPVPGKQDRDNLIAYFKSLLSGGK